ncbi:MAG TPA: ATP-binding cassette domain-containing protein, partial [Flavisolibacter sp.]|nr:ATP-binding cassette domain-containing protein [Flavisolibacter sp.]
MNKAQIHLASVSKKFMCNSVSTSVLNAITINFIQGNTYAITGLSGAGKSTFLHITAGLDTPTNGTVFFNNIPLSHLSTKDLSFHLNKSIGLLFQSAHFIKELSVLENIMLPGLISNKDKIYLK